MRLRWSIVRSAQWERGVVPTLGKETDMDTTDKRTATATTVGAPVTAAAQEPTAPQKKRASTGATRLATRIEFRTTKALSRVSAAVDKGMARYMSRRDASDLKRKDGALMDMPENMLRAAAKGVADATPALGDVSKLVYSRRNRKAVRRMMRALPSIPYFS